MDILLIGNGFDLAHDLPTGYPDFLGFCKMIIAVYDVDNNDNADKIWTGLGIKLKNDINVERLKLKFSELYSSSITKKNGNKDSFVSTNTVFDELYNNIKDNIWIEYFFQNPLYQKDNWIDFESEICKVVKSLGDDMVKKNEKRYQLTDEIEIYFSNEYLEEYVDKHFFGGKGEGRRSSEVTFKSIRDIMYKDLNRLTRALEIYLADYVKKIEIKKVSLDIQNIKIDRLLSFNYTETYKTIYQNLDSNRIDYIHGQADISNTIEKNDMVLGIDEYLPPKRRNKEIEFIAFKKFYQRIYKQTGCKYKDWVDEIKENRKEIEEKLRKNYLNQIPFQKFTDKHYLYIFGHSLDVTDRDILRDLILNDNVYTTIFYLNKEVMGQQIANLVKVIGQDELIRRTGGSTKTIEFRVQQEMVEKK